MLRVYGPDSKPVFDLLCLASESEELLSRTDVVGHQPFGTQTTEVKGAKLEALSVLLFDGERKHEMKPLAERRAACIEEFKLFGGREAMLDDGKRDYPVLLSERLAKLTDEILAKYK